MTLDNFVMMTTNKLTKILSGVATLGIAAAMATPAQASSFTVPLNGTGNGFVNTTIAAGGGLSIGATVYNSVMLGDTLFYDFSIEQDVAVGDQVRFVLNRGVWTVQYRPLMSSGVGTGKLHYKVDISDPKLVFKNVAFDTDISGPPGNKNYLATKEVFTLDGTRLITLTSTNGSQDSGSIFSFNANTIKVIDTYTSLDGFSSLLQSSTNDFTEDVDPPSSIPEPGTILGLLTVGGLGLVSQFKKQK